MPPREDTSLQITGEIKREVCDQEECDLALSLVWWRTHQQVNIENIKQNIQVGTIKQNIQVWE